MHLGRGPIERSFRTRRESEAPATNVVKLAGSFRNGQMLPNMARPLRAHNAIIVIISQKGAMALP
jgi:hypothetical protein